MSGVTSAIFTFDEIFSWLFNPFKKPISEFRVIEELPVHLIEKGALDKLKSFCQKHKLQLDIVDLRENVIGIKVKV